MADAARDLVKMGRKVRLEGLIARIRPLVEEAAADCKSSVVVGDLSELDLDLLAEEGFLVDVASSVAGSPTRWRLNWE